MALSDAKSFLAGLFLNKLCIVNFTIIVQNGVQDWSLGFLS